MSAYNESLREDTAKSHQRADKRDDAPSTILDNESLLDFTNNEVVEARVAHTACWHFSLLGLKPAGYPRAAAVAVRKDRTTG